MTRLSCGKVFGTQTRLLDLTTMTDDIIVPIPNLALPELLFTLSNPTLHERHSSARTKLLDGIQADRVCFSFSGSVR